MKDSKLFNKSLIGVLLFNTLLNSNINSLAANTLDLTNIYNTKSSDELPTLDTWEMNLARPTAARTGLGVANIGKDIYLISGQGLQGAGIHVNKYDAKTNTFSDETAIPTLMNNFTTATYKNIIYCFGSNIVQAYNTITKEWETKTSMLTPRTGATSTTVGNKIYVIGGNNSDIVEVYDIENDSWDTLENMPTARSGLISAAIDNKIYAIGGYDGSEYLNTVEVYDIENDSWDTLENMPTARAYSGSALVDNKLYVAGGKNGSNLKTVEVYNIESNEWETKGEISTAKTNLTGCVVDEYIYWVENNSPNYIHKYRAKWTDEESAINSVNIAESSSSLEDIQNARRLVNSLPESAKKDELQNRLNNLFITSGGVIKETASSNADVYIVMKNTISLSLDTNSIIFDDFTGVEDIEKRGAINLTVESSLPYEISASLEGDIQNSDGTITVDKSVLNIKSHDKVDYSSFTAIGTPIVLLDNQIAGNINNHPIDLKLNSNIISKADVYKTTIKFEVKQK